MNKTDTYLEQFIDRVVAYLPDLISAVVFLIIGMLLIKLFRRFMDRLMARPEHDPTVIKFLKDVATWIFRILLAITVITRLGVPNTQFAAIIAAAGLAVGLSLQGSLSNFAGGILIILFKPFRLGDYIEAQGQAGTVNSIQIFSTRLVTSNHQVVYLPNGALSNGTIKNFSQEPQRRAEIVLSVDYATDLRHAKQVITNVIAADPKILTDPAPGLEIRALAENSIDIAVYIWAERPDYAKMVSDFYENIKVTFENEKIEFPFPHRDVTITKIDRGNKE